LEFFPPPKNAPNIRVTPASWPHEEATEDQLKKIEIAHRETRTLSDKIAYNMVRFLRWGTDLATGYRHDPNKPYIMNERKWLVRFIFLETVAGVPGMVGGMLRHFRSLRRMKRDNGWIETLLEDAYNERMHLLTFLKMAEPGWFMKLMIMGAQGVFANGFFLAYLVSPKICHRFVGYLEEEATKTYTYAIEDLENGKLPAWQNLEAPDIAVSYWKMPEGHRTMKDLLYYIRADEAKHREIHHTLGNLDPTQDPNPFVSVYKDPAKPHPGKGLEHIKSTGWEREEVI
ncbi:putative alternative oxidase, partial [Aureobasidium melanogenum]